MNVVSIPRLEFCGALLLARLGSYVISIIESQPVQFVSRHGLSSIVFSDNATYFTGADETLKSLFKETSKFSKKVAKVIPKDDVEWSFITPRTPNFGGS